MSEVDVASTHTVDATSRSPSTGRWFGARHDVAGIGALVAIAAAYLSPALRDGPAFGTYDFVLQLSSLGKGLYPWPPHNGINSDVVSQMSAWQVVDWRAVHQGHFPLWNDLTLLGLPHFLNFESAALGLPNLVSYLVPLRYSFLVAVLVKLLVAGTGAYVFCRVVGLGAAASTLAGTTFMLSGGFANWLTWPLSDVVSWTGWLAAAAVLAYRWKGRSRWVLLLAGCTAFSIYGGFPEAYAFEALVLGVLGLVVVVALVAGGRAISRRGVARVLAGIGGGVALSAPLWLPGLQVISIAHRARVGGFPGTPARALSLLLVPGYYGLPIKGSAFFLGGSNYYETVAYLGVIAAVLAVAGVVRWWRHPLVVGLVVCCAVLVFVSYQTKSFHVFQSVARSSGLGSIEWGRARSVLGFPVGVLAGIGLDSLLRVPRDRRVTAGYAAGVVACAGALAVLGVEAGRSALPALERNLQVRSLWWPIAMLGVCVAAGVACVLAGRWPARRRWLLVVSGGALVVANAASLVIAGAGVNSYASVPYARTAAIAALQARVGAGLVGLDDGKPGAVQVVAPVGFYPETNLGYSVALFAAHDPLMPQRYFATLAPGQGTSGPSELLYDVTNAAVARFYGVAWILALPGLPAPAGARYVGTYAGERLYSVPGAARFSFAVATGAEARVTAVGHPVPSSYTMVTRSARPAHIVLRVTDVPGWHLTIGGKPAPLGRFGGVMLSADVPAGRHSLHLWYFPDRLRTGIWLAVAAAVLLGVGSFAVFWRRRRQPPLRFDDGLWLEWRDGAAAGVGPREAGGSGTIVTP